MILSYYEIFTPLRVGGPPTPHASLANSNIYTKNQSKTFFLFSVFTMCSVENTVIYAVFGIKSVQDSCFCSVFKALASKNVQSISPNPWKHRYLHCFLQFFHVPMPLANSNIYTKNPSNTLIFPVFLHFFRQKRRNLHVFRVQNTGFCSVFNALASKNHSKYRYLQCFFISVRFSLAGSRPKWPKIPFQWPLKLRHPKIVEKTRKHHPTEVSVRNRFWGPQPPLPPS